MPCPSTNINSSYQPKKGGSTHAAPLNLTANTKPPLTARPQGHLFNKNTVRAAVLGTFQNVPPMQLAHPLVSLWHLSSSSHIGNLPGSVSEVLPDPCDPWVAFLFSMTLSLHILKVCTTELAGGVKRNQCLLVT